MKFTEEKDESSWPLPIVYGAAAAGAVTGFLLSGPAIAVGLAVAGAGAVLSQSPGTFIGGFARNIGQLSVNSYEAVKKIEQDNNIINKAQKWADDNNVVERGKTGAKDFITKAKQMDKKYGVTKEAGRAILEGIKQANKAFEAMDKADSK